VEYSDREELKTILDRTTTGYQADIQPVITGEEILGAQNLVRRA